MMYRGYLIDRTPPELTDNSLPWAFGQVGSGRGIIGWARTRKDAKAAVDRDIERREHDAFAKVAAEAGLTEALESSGHTFVPDVDPARPANANHPRQCLICGAGQFAHP